MYILKSTTALAVLLLSGVAFAQDKAPLRDLSVEQTSVAQIIAPHPGPLTTAIFADRADGTYATGETVRLTLKASQDSYVTVLDIGPGGSVTQIFPNAYQGDNRLHSGQSLDIAGPNSGARISVSLPTGTELIKVITSNKPITLIPDAQLHGAGPFRIVEGGVAALMRDLSVVSEAPASNESFISFANFALYTVPGRAPAMPTARVEVPAEQPFPLLLAVDKVKYRSGENATVAVTTTQACTLTVLEFDQSGIVRTLLPVAGAPNSPLAANQTVFVGGGSGPELIMSGAAGAVQLLATCTTAEAVAAGVALPAVANGAADAVVISRQLSVVAGKPGTAMASAIVAVTP